MGSGGSVGAVVTVGARAGSASEGVSYDGGWVSSVAAGNAPLDMRRAAMAGAGGGGLGAGESVSAGSRWGQSGAEASEWVSGSSVRGRAAGGVGGSRTVAVTGGGGVGSVSVGLSYDGWQVSGVSTSNGAGAAGYWRAAVGVGAGMLGVLASSAGGRVGQSGAESTEWASDSWVVCGVGFLGRSSVTMAVTAGESAGSVSGAGTYDVGSVSSGGGTNGGAVGAGAGLGVLGVAWWVDGGGGWSGGARAGMSGCESSAWASSTGVLCRRRAGAGGSLAGVVTLGGSAGTLTAALSADSGVAGAAGVNAGSGTGGSRATMAGGWGVGAGMASGAGRAGSSGCEESVWASDTAVACVVAGGSGGSWVAAATVGQQVGSGSEAVSYDAGWASGVAGSGNGLGRGGSGTVLATGGVGAWYSGAARSGRTGGGVTGWVSGTSVVVRWSGGVSGSVGLVVSAGVGVGGSVSGAVSYDRAGGAGASVWNGAGGGGGAGWVVTVSGGGLGGGDESVRVGLGGSGSEGTWWVSDSAVRCGGASGAGRSLGVAATAGAEVGLSVTEAMSYDSGEARAGGAVANWGVAGGRVVGMVAGGRDVGSGSGSSVAARSGGTGCESTVWAGDGGVVCYASQGGGWSGVLAATIGAVVGSTTEAWSRDGVAVSAASGTNGGCGGVGGTPTTAVAGQGLGGRDGTVRGRVGASGCESSVWTSDTSARCLEGHGGGGSRGASVTASGAQGSVSGAVSMDAGGGAAVAGGAANGLGAQDTSWDVVLGTGATGDGRSWTVRGRVGGSGAQASVWSGDTAVTCRAEMGSGGSLRSSITNGFATSSVSLLFSYNRDFVTSLRFSNIVFHDDTLVFSSGLIYFFSSHIRTGSTSSEASIWVSESAISIMTVSGSGCSAFLAVTVQMQTTSLSNVITYDLSVLVPQYPYNQIPINPIVSVTGLNFGVLNLSPWAAFEYTASPSVEWLSDSQILCRMSISSVRAEAHNKLVVSVYNQVSSVSGFFSIDSFLLNFVTSQNQSDLGFSSDVQVLVYGEWFGASASTAQGRCEWSAAESTNWISDSAMTMRLSYGPVLRSSTVCISSNVHIATLSTILSHDTLALTGADYWDSSSSVRLLGSGFGRYDVTARGRIGFTGCSASRWISDSAMYCQTIFPQQEQSIAAVITVDLLVGMALQNIFSYQNDLSQTIINSIAPSTATSRGASGYLVYGSGFPVITHGQLQMWSMERGGPVLRHTYCANEVTNSVCKSAFRIVFAHNNFSLQIAIPPGTGNNISFVYVTNVSSPQMDLWKRMFAYDRTEIHFMKFQGLLLNVSSESQLIDGPFMLPTQSPVESRLVTIFGISLGTSQNPRVLLQGSVLGSINLNSTIINVTSYDSPPGLEMLLFEVSSFAIGDSNISLTLSLDGVQCCGIIQNCFAMFEMGKVYASLELKTSEDTLILDADSLQRSIFHITLSKQLLISAGIGTAAEDGLSVIQRTFLLSVKSGSVVVEFFLMPAKNESDAAGAWIRDARSLLAAYKSGLLESNLRVIGTLVNFQVFDLPIISIATEEATTRIQVGFNGTMLVSSTFLSLESSTQPSETETANSSIALGSSGGWDPQLVIPLSVGLAAVVALLLCCLYVQIRIALRSDEVMLKAAFSALANRADDQESEDDAMASQNPAGTPRSAPSVPTPRDSVQTPGIVQHQRGLSRRSTSVDGVNPNIPENSASIFQGVDHDLFSVNDIPNTLLADSLRSRLNTAMHPAQNNDSNPAVQGSMDAARRGWSWGLSIPTPGLIRGRLNPRLLGQDRDEGSEALQQGVSVASNLSSSSMLQSNNKNSLRDTASGTVQNDPGDRVGEEALWDSGIASEWDFINSFAFHSQIYGPQERAETEGTLTCPSARASANLDDAKQHTEAGRTLAEDMHDERIVPNIVPRINNGNEDQDIDYFSASEPESSLQQRFAGADDIFASRTSAQHQTGSERDLSSRRRHFRRRILPGIDFGPVPDSNRNDRRIIQRSSEREEQPADEDYFSASDPESSLQQRFENLDDEIVENGTVFDASRHSLEKTRSQIHLRSQRNSVNHTATQQHARSIRQSRPSVNNIQGAQQPSRALAHNFNSYGENLGPGQEEMMAARTERRAEQQFKDSESFGRGYGIDSDAADEASAEEFEEMSWDPCSESKTDGEIGDDNFTDIRVRAQFTGNASFGTMTYAPDQLDAQLEEDDLSESGVKWEEEADCSVDPSAVYVSLAPMSRAHARDDPLNIVRSPRQQQALLHDQWDYAAFNTTRAPFNTPVQAERSFQQTKREPAQSAENSISGSLVEESEDVLRAPSNNSSVEMEDVTEIPEANQGEEITVSLVTIGGQAVPSPLAPYMARSHQVYESNRAQERQVEGRHMSDFVEVRNDKIWKVYFLLR